MITFIKYVLFILLIASCFASAYYSIRSRRSSNPMDRGLYGAQMNILMGVMLVILSIIFMFIFKGSTPSIIVEALFLILGTFNIFAGIRNRSFYTNQKTNS